MLAPNVDVSTRWNSTYDMLMLALNMEPAITMLCANNISLNHLLLTEFEWSLLKEAAKFFEYFKVLSVVLSGEKYATLLLVIVGFNLLLDKLEKAKIKLIKKTSKTRVD